MVTSRFNPTVGVRAALVALARGTCYWPACDTPVIVFVGDRPRMNLQQAHIRAREKGGPRYDATMTDEQRDDFANLILLCVPHHADVDNDPQAFPVGILARWKREREQGGMDALKGLRGLTQANMEKMLAEAMDGLRDRLDKALDKLDKIDAEAASLLRLVQAEFADLRQYGRALDPDTVDSFLRGAVALNQAGFSGDTVEAFGNAAMKLDGLSATVERLEYAAENLRNANGFM